MPPALYSALLFLPAFYFCLWLSVWAHELGHVFLGRLAGYRPRSVGVGFRGPALRFRVFGVVGYQCLGGYFNGATFSAPPAVVPDRWRRIVFFSGGLLANGGIASCAVVASRAFRPVSLGFWAAILVAGVNLLLVAVALFPAVQSSGAVRLPSDGLQILATVRRRYSGRFVDSVNASRTLTPFLTKIGDGKTCGSFVAEAARYWAMLGLPAFARHLLDGAQRSPDPFPRAMWAYSEAWIALAESNIPAAEQKLAESEELFAANRDAVGRELVDLTRCELLLAAGRFDGAADCVRVPAKWLEDTRQFLRLKTAALTGGSAEADAFLAELEVNTTYEPVNRYALCASLPAQFRARGWGDRAESVEKVLLQSFLLATAGLTDAADLAEKAAGFEALSGQKPAEQPTPGKVTKPAPIRNEQLLSAAMTVAALGVTVGACLCMAGMVLVYGPKADARRETNPVIFLAGLAGLFGGVLWFAVRATHWLVARYRPTTPPPAGSLFLILAVFLAFLFPAAVAVSYQVMK